MKKRKQGDRGPITIREMCLLDWEDLKKLANEQDRKLRGLVDEMLTDILKKYAKRPQA